MKWLFSLLFVILLAVPSNAHAATTYPDPNGYVNDYAGLLTTDYASQLQAKLTLFNKKTTNQIAIVTVKTTQPETIEEYGIHLADKWKVGQKGKDNGIIMIFAMNDRKMRIEVGRGLEGDVTDIQSKHIQTDIIQPAFKQGQYQKGIDNGVNAVINTITHDSSYAATLTTQQLAQPPPNNTNSIPSLIFMIIIIGILIALSLFTPFGGTVIWLLLSILSSGGGNSGKDDGESDKFGGGGFSGGGSSSDW